MSALLERLLWKNIPIITRGAAAVFGVAIFFFGPYPSDEKFMVRNQVIIREIQNDKKMSRSLKTEVLAHLKAVDKHALWEFELSGIRTNSTQLLGALIVIAGVFAVFIMHWIDVKAAKKKG